MELWPCVTFCGRMCCIIFPFCHLSGWQEMQEEPSLIQGPLEPPEWLCCSPLTVLVSGWKEACCLLSRRVSIFAFLYLGICFRVAHRTLVRATCRSSQDWADAAGVRVCFVPLCDPFGSFLFQVCDPSCLLHIVFFPLGTCSGHCVAPGTGFCIFAGIMFTEQLMSTVACLIFLLCPPHPLWGPRTCFWREGCWQVLHNFTPAGCCSQSNTALHT